MSHLANLVLVQPDMYQGFDEGSAEAYLIANQRVLGILRQGVINLGEEQLKARSGFSSSRLPDYSPHVTGPFVLDGISFTVTNTVKRTIEYQKALDAGEHLLEDVCSDWKSQSRRVGIRTYKDSHTKEKSPFIRWDYLMRHVYHDLARVTNLKVEPKIEVAAPEQYDTMKLERLVLPLQLIYDSREGRPSFDINKPGAAKLWYLARRFAQEVVEATTIPFEQEMEDRSGIDRMPDETTKHAEQIAQYLFSVQTIPSPRRQPGKVFDRLFAIPEKEIKKARKKGEEESRGGVLPTILSDKNYQTMLESYRDQLDRSLKVWKSLECNLGELMVFYYGLENHPRVQEEFPFLPEYQLKRDGDLMFVSVQAVYDRMLALEKDFTKARTLRRHDVMPIV